MYYAGDDTSNKAQVYEAKSGVVKWDALFQQVLRIGKELTEIAYFFKDIAVNIGKILCSSDSNTCVVTNEKDSIIEITKATFKAHTTTKRSLAFLYV